MRDSDIIGRYGGEEFAVILPETKLETALEIAERVRQAVENDAVRIDGESGDIKYTLSIGVSAFTREVGTVATVFEAADKGLYEAKTQGRNRVVAKEVGAA
jgi:diguanylate cyclase (GGDEF)-like protein